MAEKELNLKIITPKGIELDDRCKTVTLSTIDGKIGILPMHIPLITILKKGRLKFVKENKEIFLQIDGGIAKIKDNIVTVITPSFKISS